MMQGINKWMNYGRTILHRSYNFVKEVASLPFSTEKEFNLDTQRDSHSPLNNKLEIK